MPISPENLTKIENFIRKTMRKKKVPGLSIGIIQGDKVLHARGYGYRDLEKGLSMTADTLIGIASVTKSITAFAIMKLVQEGKLSLEESVATYLSRPPFSNHPEIKLKHLLSHSSGIPAADAQLAQMFYNLGDFKNIYPVATKDDFFYHISAPDDYNLFKPEEKFFYNNDMFTCLGFIIENITGKKYSEYIQELIFEPLQIKRATFSKEEYDQDPLNDKIVGYLPKTQDGKQSLRRVNLSMYEFLQAPGGLNISANDMLKYAQLILNRGKWDGKEILTDEMFSKLWDPIISCPYGLTPEGKYALGWVIDDSYLGTKLVHHGGGLGTSCTSLILAPDLNLGIYVGQNSCNISPSIIARYALAIILGKDPHQELKELQVEPILDEIQGKYYAPHDLYSAEILLEGGVLWAKLQIDDGSLKFPLIPKDILNLTFTLGLAQLPPVPKIQFYRDNNTGKISSVTYDRYLYIKN
ncbi:D-aminopeptidase [Candidatus Lokiarchaeum ossiferum]|uniref:D-aminopeptidase n=1 Tax=Candidatus Lokiarchaeum ossiferum TaxID=2951803 RepID=A0ABY6HZ63_9ARCH|nr:D-aminopeptidase [Candidatus Lokiarchaeum sp. B-35]